MNISKPGIVVLLVLFFLSLLGSGLVFAKDRQNRQQVSGEEQEMMKLIEKYATPGEFHRHLDYFVGQWQSLQEVWMEPGAEPISRKQEITVKSILGGRFLQAHIKGEMMGKPIEGIVLTGYDNYKQVFFAIQMNNMSTGYMISSGTLDKTGKIRTETALYDDALSGKQVKLKAVTTLIDRDRYLYQLYYIEPGDTQGKEIKSMEILYTRVK